MQNRQRIAVVGATGRVGHHVADVLEEGGHDVVSISRSLGVDVITREGLAEALAGVGCIVDCSAEPTGDQARATEFFETASRNLHELGSAAGVERMVVVSIIKSDRYQAGYAAATFAHEQAALAGPIPVQILRASQFHELVELLLGWGTSDGVGRVPEMRTRPVAARTVAEELAAMAVGSAPAAGAGDPIPEIAGPREESFVELARLLARQRGEPARVEGFSDPADPDRELRENGGLLPSPHAKLAGPTFAEWLGPVAAAA